MDDVPKWILDMDDPEFLRRTVYGEKKEEEDQVPSNKGTPGYLHRRVTEPTARPKPKDDKK